jgi:hypothetical protein
VLAIRAAAAALGRERLEDCDLWVSLEPCPMCAGAIMHARIARLYYAAPDPKGGAVAHGARLFDQPTCLHRPEVYAGLGEEEAATLLRDFSRAVADTDGRAVARPKGAAQARHGLQRGGIARSTSRSQPPGPVSPPASGDQAPDWRPQRHRADRPPWRRAKAAHRGHL